MSATLEDNTIKIEGSDQATGDIIVKITLADDISKVKYNNVVISEDNVEEVGFDYFTLIVTDDMNIILEAEGKTATTYIVDFV